MDIYGRPDSDANGLLCCPDWLDDLLDHYDHSSQQPSQQPSQQLSQQPSQLDIYPF